MIQPQRYLTRMTFFVIAVIVIAGALYTPLERAFLSNPILNGVILGVLLLGIGYVFRQVFQLRPEVDWLESYRREEPGLSVPRAPTLLAPMATMLGEREDRNISLSAISTRSLLDSISSRLDESRELSRYLIGLLIFLGLLGTFWGLLEAVASVGITVQSLSASDQDFQSLFTNLQSGLEAPLSGMGTAFSSSLFGLAGSLVLGFLELQASQAQNRFYNYLEEWLSSLTRLSSGTLSDVDHTVPDYVSALLEQTAESIDNLQRTLTRGEESRISANATFLALADRLATLTDQMQAEQNLLVKLTETQMAAKPLLEHLSTATDKLSNSGLDEASRTHLRNIDVYMARLVEDSAQGRGELVGAIRSELKVLARTVANSNTQDKRK